MQARSEESVSATGNRTSGTGGAATPTTEEVSIPNLMECNNNKQTTPDNDAEPSLTEILKHSLAIVLVRVRVECGPRTAKKILSILYNDAFDLADFKITVPSLEQCEVITSNTKLER